MAKDRIENAKRIAGVSKMADTSLMGGAITEDEHRKVKRKTKELALDNLFEAMANYCSQE